MVGDREGRNGKGVESLGKKVRNIITVLAVWVTKEPENR